MTHSISNFCVDRLGLVQAADLAAAGPGAVPTHLLVLGVAPPVHPRRVRAGPRHPAHPLHADHQVSGALEGCYEDEILSPS